jgi:2-polyprenyl-6-methoxyphenol hydroxylase-like FAD-dependent oxidoreductase
VVRLPPSGGFGMNTGLQDVHNLAWKIAQIVCNNASLELLSTYEQGTSYKSVIGTTII